MKISVSGKQLDLGQNMRSYVEEHLEIAVTKFFDSSIGANVVFSKDGADIRADVTVHPMSGVVVQAAETHADAYAAFDGAKDRIIKQLRKYKKRLTDHKGKTEKVNFSVIEPEHAGEGDELSAEEGAPMIIAEMQKELPLCTVSGAVMRMDLSDAPALLFRNTAHGRLNMVYRRKDGNIGWIDPQATK